MANITKISSHHATYMCQAAYWALSIPPLLFTTVYWVTADRKPSLNLTTVRGPLSWGLCALRCVLQHFPVLLCLGKGRLPFLAPTSVDGQLDLANRRHRLEGEDEEEARVALIPSLSLLETASLAAAECPLWLLFPLHGPLGF